MSDLPGGTVTFLFTDVEGSTRLLAEHGEGYAGLLAEHRRLLRDAFAAHGGVEVDTQGDAFFVAFAHAPEAFAAACEAQEALAATPVRVRIGIHTGEPQVTDEGYVGMDVHRAARIAAAGHGGQILVSERSRSLLDGTELTDLGLHRLKDLGQPEKLFQLGQESFPPLKTLDATNLPAQPGPLIGRERELEELVALVRAERVVTMTGSGGSGKTRLALQVAAELVGQFSDGVFWVPLAAVTGARLVVATIGSTLGAQADPASHIDERRMLLLLDNLEQVLEAAPALSELVGRCPNLHLLVTSRALLRIAGECGYAVDPLPEADAVELFRRHAAVAEPEAAVLEICRRVDCLPLAVELAAARTALLPPELLLERLAQRLPVLTGGRRDAPARQRTLRATIEWSYELLSSEEQTLFRQLAVFVGSFDVAAAEEVAGADLDGFQSLIEKSLLRRWGSGRLGMLETVREYAGERLDETVDAQDVRERHANYYMGVAESAGLAADDEARPQRHALVIADQANIRAALDFYVGSDELESAMLTFVALENFWVTNDPQEGIRRGAALVERVDEVSPLTRARMLRAYASSAYLVGDEHAVDALERSLAEHRSLGDERGIAILLHRLAVAAAHQGDTAQARALADESLALHRRSGSKKGECQAIGLLAHLEHEEGRGELALKLIAASISLAGEVGFIWWQAGNALLAAEWAQELGRRDEADRWAREAMSAAHGIGDSIRCMSALMVLSRLAADADQLRRAGLLWGAAEAEEERTTVPLPIWWDENRARRDPTAQARTDAAFEDGRLEGRRLALGEAVAAAVRDL
ncbi:MAG: adenylate/guanylate cyclase domain-containing protein [Gaiellaceae bacterium]